LRLARENAPTQQGGIELTALEVHDRFGGSAIEEVMEFGSAAVQEME
jgi:hypothetical protein